MSNIYKQDTCYGFYEIRQNGRKEREARRERMTFEDSSLCREISYGLLHPLIVAPRGR
jgi:hypothetical protein